MKEPFSKLQTTGKKENVLHNRYFKRISKRISQISGLVCSEKSVSETFIFQISEHLHWPLDAHSFQFPLWIFIG